MTQLKDRPMRGGRTTGRPGKGRTGADPQSPEAKVASEAAVRSKRQGDTSLVVGAVPRVDLLPTEVLVDRRQKATVRRAWVGVVLVAILMAAGVATANAYADSAGRDLAAAQATTNAIDSQLAQYAPLRAMQSQSVLLQAAQEVGGSTEIDWSSYLGNVQSSLPSGVSITGVTIDSASPLETYTQATGPLEGQRVATLTIDASSSTLPSVPTWLDSVKKLKGYVDANANSVTLDTTSNVYTVDMTIHINESAFDDKYAAKGK